ncbi:MAG: glycoside hydrolase family 16 protein [Acidobacteria bacterium]|nr:glycoside hydrolase family 16 protein [Acidobacteriota bacterium]
MKRTDYAMGPRANYWSDSPDNVWLDEQGQLHLRMTERNGRWYSAEVCSEESFGYGDYAFFLASRVDQLDPSVVAALFTYETDDREIDIEFSRWGCVNVPNTQYGIQPFGTLDERTCQVYPFARRGFRFQTATIGTLTTHRFGWRPGTVSFSSDHGHVLARTRPTLAEWTYTGSVPTPGVERVHMSLWWAKNAPPVMKPTGPQELVVTAVLLPPDLR